jgi:hypothetical protein
MFASWPTDLCTFLAGDADTVILRLKFMLPLFHEGGRTQYSVEVLVLLFDVLLRSSPLDADAVRQALFFCNKDDGHAFGSDLEYEFMVGHVKAVIATLGANATLANISRSDFFNSFCRRVFHPHGTTHAAH